MPTTVARFLSHAATDGTAVCGALAVDDGEFSGLRYETPADYVVRELRGTKMRSTAAVFDEFAAAFQFAYYFGENKDAFDECLRDLADFVGPAAGYVVAIRTAEQLLADEPAERDWFAEAVRDAAEHWSSYGCAFRVVLQGRAPIDAEPLAL